MLFRPPRDATPEELARFERWRAAMLEKLRALKRPTTKWVSRRVFYDSETLNQHIKSRSKKK